MADRLAPEIERNVAVQELQGLLKGMLRDRFSRARSIYPSTEYGQASEKLTGGISRDLVQAPDALAQNVYDQIALIESWLLTGEQHQLDPEENPDYPFGFDAEFSGLNLMVRSQDPEFDLEEEIDEEDENSPSDEFFVNIKIPLVISESLQYQARVDVGLQWDGTLSLTIAFSDPSKIKENIEEILEAVNAIDMLYASENKNAFVERINRLSPISGYTEFGLEKGNMTQEEAKIMLAVLKLVATYL